LAFLLPLAVQALIFAALIFGSRDGGSCVALGAMPVGIIAVPATMILIWARLRSRKPEGGSPGLADRHRLVQCAGSGGAAVAGTWSFSLALTGAPGAVACCTGRDA